MQNEYFDLFLQNDEVVLRLKQEGYPLKSFDQVTRQHPRIKIHSFTTLRSALSDVEQEQTIGSWLPLVEATVALNKMHVELIINATTTEIEEKRAQILSQAEKVLDKLGVIYGRRDLSEEIFVTGDVVLGAVGTAPIKGDDAVITYIERPERKPVIREDGSADHYEMNFVFPIKEDDWLGEKVLPTDGTPGTDVFGNPIAAIRGSDAMLQYDRKSIVEQEEDGKVVLRAAFGGALEYQDNLISVGKQLLIQGDVGPETGSIVFDGAVVVYGTITAGYSVNATGDISVEGVEGVTNAKGIQSSEGAVYIKGGIFGGGDTIIEAKGSIYLKHANNCKLYAKEVHVGLYLFGTDVIADRVMLDKNRGRIIGGNIKALYLIECAIVGNNHERVTNLCATGVDQPTLQRDIKDLAHDLKERQGVVAQLHEHVAQFSKLPFDKLSHDQKEALTKMKETIESNEMIVLETDSEIQQLLRQLKESVPPQIEVSKEAFPGTTIQIAKSQAFIHESTSGVFKMVDGVLNI